MFLPLAPAAQNLGVGLRRPCRRKVCGGMFEAVSRIAPPQPSEAMARIAPLFIVPPERQTIQLMSPATCTSRLFFGVDSRFETARSSSAFYFFGIDSKSFAKVQIDSKRENCSIGGSSPPVSHAPPNSKILRLAQQRFLLDPLCSVASFEVNSEPHTGARPSFRLCVGLITGANGIS
jgi:hypothetical protein